MSEMTPEAVALDEWKRYARYWEIRARQQTDRLRDSGYTLNSAMRHLDSGDIKRAMHDLSKLQSVIRIATQPKPVRLEPGTNTSGSNQRRESKQIGETPND